MAFEICMDKAAREVSRLIADLKEVFRAGRSFDTPLERLRAAQSLARLARDLLMVSPPVPVELLVKLEETVETTEERIERFAKANQLELE